jgi:hypothetical protein
MMDSFAGMSDEDWDRYDEIQRCREDRHDYHADLDDFRSEPDYDDDYDDHQYCEHENCTTPAAFTPVNLYHCLWDSAKKNPRVMNMTIVSATNGPDGPIASSILAIGPAEPEYWGSIQPPIVFSELMASVANLADKLPDHQLFARDKRGGISPIWILWAREKVEETYKYHLVAVNDLSEQKDQPTEDADFPGQKIQLSYVWDIAAN